MGQALSYYNISARIAIFGWNGAGKTALLYTMVGLKDIQTIPTIGFNVEQFTQNNVKFNAWDVGGRGKIRALHKHYYAGNDAVIYIVDSNDQEQMGDAAEEFSRMVKEPELQDCIFLLLANKQDLPGALPLSRIAELFNTKDVKQRFFMQATCVTSKDGLDEAFLWLADELKQRKQSKMSQIKQKIANYTSYLRCWAPQTQIVE